MTNQLYVIALTSRALHFQPGCDGLSTAISLCLWEWKSQVWIIIIVETDDCPNLAQNKYHITTAMTITVSKSKSVSSQSKPWRDTKSGFSRLPDLGGPWFLADYWTCSDRSVRPDCASILCKSLKCRGIQDGDTPDIQKSPWLWPSLHQMMAQWSDAKVLAGPPHLTWL